MFAFFITGYIASSYLLAKHGIAEWVFIILLVGYIGWYALLGNTLYHYLLINTTYSITWFIADAFLIILFYAATAFVFDGSFQANGLLAVPAFYILFAITHLVWFPAVLLVLIENRKEATFSQYADIALQLFLWPIGIWFVQPRLNKLSQSLQQTDSKEHF